MLIRYRTHNASNSQTVKIIVNKNQNSQNDRSKLCPHSCFDPFAGPSSKSRRTSGLIHHAYHSSKDHKKNQDSHIIAVRQNTDDPTLKNMGHGSLKGKSGIQKTSYQNSQKQRAVYLLCDQCQRNGYYRRNQRPECSIKRRLRRLLCFCRKYRQRTCQNSQKYHCKNSQEYFSFILHIFPPSDMKRAMDVSPSGVLHGS